jgi:hypothetical protein
MLWLCVLTAWLLTAIVNYFVDSQGCGRYLEGTFLMGSLSLSTFALGYWQQRREQGGFANAAAPIASGVTALAAIVNAFRWISCG